MEIGEARLMRDAVAAVGRVDNLHPCVRLISAFFAQTRHLSLLRAQSLDVFLETADEPIAD